MLTISLEQAGRSPGWDEFVARAPGGDLVQTSAWADFRAAEGFECARVVARRAGVIEAGMQVYVRRVGPWRLAYVPYGPLVGEGAPGEAVAGLARRFGRDALSIGAVFLQPPLAADAVATGLAASGFRPGTVNVAPSASLRIDLSRPLDVIRAGFSKYLRRDLSRGERRGVAVRPGDERDLDLLAALHRQSAQHQDFAPLSRAYLGHLWDTLAPRGHARVFVGTTGGVPAAVLLLTSHAGVVTARITGFDRAHDHAKVPAAVTWAALVDAHERGERWFDLGGVKRSIAKRLLSGQSSTVAAKHEFKLRFGPEPVLYPAALERIDALTLRAGLAASRGVKPGRKVLQRAAVQMRQRGA